MQGCLSDQRHGARARRVQAEARTACFSCIEGWRNPVRLHSALGCRSPIAYEQEQAQTVEAEP